MASSQVKIEIQGLENLARLMNLLPGKLASRMADHIMRKAVKPLIPAMRAADNPDRTKLLDKSIGLKMKTYRRRTIVAIVGARSGIQGTLGASKVVPINYSHLVDLGTRPHAIGSKSKLARERYRTVKDSNGVRRRILIGYTQQVQRGRMHPGSKARPFRARALAATQAQIVKTIEDETAIAVDKAISDGWKPI